MEFFSPKKLSSQQIAQKIFRSACSNAANEIAQVVSRHFGDIAGELKRVDPNALGDANILGLTMAVGVRKKILSSTMCVDLDLDILTDGPEKSENIV